MSTIFRGTAGGNQLSFSTCTSNNNHSRKGTICRRRNATKVQQDRRVIHRLRPLRSVLTIIPSRLGIVTFTRANGTRIKRRSIMVGIIIVGVDSVRRTRNIIHMSICRRNYINHANIYVGMRNVRTYPIFDYSGNVAGYTNLLRAIDPLSRREVIPRRRIVKYFSIFASLITTNLRNVPLRVWYDNSTSNRRCHSDPSWGASCVPFLHFRSFLFLPGIPNNFYLGSRRFRAILSKDSPGSSLLRRRHFFKVMCRVRGRVILACRIVQGVQTNFYS